jgi:hypothetical protein
MKTTTTHLLLLEEIKLFFKLLLLFRLDSYLDKDVILTDYDYIIPSH